MSTYGIELTHGGLVSCGYAGYSMTYVPAAEKCDRQNVQIHGRFVEPAGHPGEAQLTVDILKVYDAKNRSLMVTGCLNLVADDARKLALAIAPPDVAIAVNAHAQLVDALREARRAILDHGDERTIAPTIEVIDTALALASAAP